MGKDVDSKDDEPRATDESKSDGSISADRISSPINQTLAEFANTNDSSKTTDDVIEAEIDGTISEDNKNEKDNTNDDISDTKLDNKSVNVYVGDTNNVKGETEKESSIDGNVEVGYSKTDGDNDITDGIQNKDTKLDASETRQDEKVEDNAPRKGANSNRGNWGT